jgi:cytochrome c
MRKCSIFVLVFGLAVLINIGLATDGVASMHDQAGMKAEGKHLLTMPMMNPASGRKLFASKGCVVCHSINGVGGEDAPPLDAETMPTVMNPFDFAAKMWRGAGTMIALQEDELGEQIEFTGNELANIIAFVHNAEEQKKFSRADIPSRIKELMRHMGEESEEHETEEHGLDKSND